jgi:hypothetical protein
VSCTALTQQAAKQQDGWMEIIPYPFGDFPAACWLSVMNLGEAHVLTNA